MIVISIGSSVYSVAESLGRKYTVSLRAHCWNGSCTCPAFRGCALFVLKHQGDSMNRESTRCDHIRAVREWFMENEVPALVEQQEKIIELPTNETRLSDIGS